MTRSGHVAIVDDDPSIRTALARLLGRHGIECRTYSSARDFLEALPSGAPHCLIVDVNMPDMTGLELQRELSKAGFRIPAIVITANADQRIARAAASLGAVAFLPKPVPADKLMAAVTSCSQE